MEKQKKVIDASIVVKWFSHEENSDKAIKIKDDFLKGNVTLIAPSMILLETINALKYKKRNEKQLLHANEELFKLDLKLEEINQEILSKTIENSIRYNITIYDSLYVTIGQIHGTFLITADKELYKVPNVIALEKI